MLRSHFLFVFCLLLTIFQSCTAGSGDCISDSMLNEVHTEYSPEWYDLRLVADYCCFGKCTYNEIYYNFADENHRQTVRLLHEYNCLYMDVNCGTGMRCAPHITRDLDDDVSASCIEDRTTTPARTTSTTSSTSERRQTNPPVITNPPRQESESSGLSTGEIAGIIVGALVLLGIIIGLFVGVCIRLVRDGRVPARRPVKRQPKPAHSNHKGAANKPLPQPSVAAPASKVPSAPIPVVSRNHLPQRPMAPGNTPGTHVLATKAPTQLAVIQGGYRAM